MLTFEKILKVFQAYLDDDLKAVERLRKTAEQLSRQERDKPHDRELDR